MLLGQADNVLKVCGGAAAPSVLPRQLMCLLEWVTSGLGLGTRAWQACLQAAVQLARAAPCLCAAAVAEVLGCCMPSASSRLQRPDDHCQVLPRQLGPQLVSGSVFSCAILSKHVCCRGLVT